MRVLQIDRNKSGRLDGINLLCRDFVEEIIVSYKVTTFLGRTNLEYTGIARNQSQNSFDSPPAISIVDSLSHRRPSDRHKIMQNKRLGLGQRGGEASNNESALSKHKKLADFSQGYSGKKMFIQYSKKINGLKLKVDLRNRSSSPNHRQKGVLTSW